MSTSIATHLKADLKAYGQSLGFDRVGFTAADPLDGAEGLLRKWLADGRAGEMAYLKRNPSLRTRPIDLLPGARSVVCLAMNYFTEGLEPPAEGRISRYAKGKDYHKVLAKRLEAFVRYLEAMAPGAVCKTFVDTGPLLEKAFAQRAGLGFIGKHTLVITRGLGSWVFLGSVITTLELPPDLPDARGCGDCRLCLDACPTEAIVAPYQLDARRCISYLTIESDDAIPFELRSSMGGWVFGCDICQEVCPHNARPVGAVMASFDGTPPSLREILSLRTEEDFRNRLGASPITRAGLEGLQRNACVAAANLQRHDLRADLEMLRHESASELVREHAGWAVRELTRLE